MVTVTSSEWTLVHKSYGLQILRFTNLMVTLHSCERACLPALSSKDEVIIMIMGRPLCNTLWWFKVGWHTLCQIPICNIIWDIILLNYLHPRWMWTPNFNHLLSIPLILVGKLTIFTLPARGWGQNPSPSNQTTNVQILTDLQNRKDNLFGYVASSL